MRHSVSLPAGSRQPLPGFPDPLVRYPLSVEDRRDLATGLQRLAQMLFAAGARELYPSIAGVPRLISAAEIRLLPAEIPRERSSVMTIHLFSSCPMGENRRLAAADSFGRLHGLSGLRVQHRERIARLRNTRAHSGDSLEDDITSTRAWWAGFASIIGLGRGAASQTSIELHLRVHIGSQNPLDLPCINADQETVA